MLIFDNHLHLRRDGRYIEAIKDFEKAGGTHCVLCQYPQPEKVLEKQSYVPLYQDTLTMAKEVQQQTKVKMFITVGPYPVDYLFYCEKKDRQFALTMMKQGMEEAKQFCFDHELCVAIGEIGRPHFPVDEQVIQDANDILRYGMEQAKDAKVPIVLHTESTTPQQCRELANMAKEVGFSVEKLIKHYAPPLITFEENAGLIPSVLASKKNIEIALQKGDRFLMETDYIDDLNRPGAVLGPKTVPKVTCSFLERGIMSEQQAYNIHCQLPEGIYDITLEER